MQERTLVALKCESEDPKFDQSVHPIYLDKEDEEAWYGWPVMNPNTWNSPPLKYPRFAWKEIGVHDKRV